MPEFKALMTAIYPVPDLAIAKEWYAKAFEKPPYFDAPFYVGFNIGGHELGLVPTEAPLHEPGNRGVIAYWGVEDAQTVFASLIALGARPLSAVKDVGEGIEVGVVEDPFGNALGIIRNPHFGKPA